MPSPQTIIFSLRLVCIKNILKNINITYSLVFSGSYKTQLVTTPPPKSLSLHCNQIKKVKKELDGQLSSLSTCMQVPDYEVIFSPMHLVFLELNTHRHHLDFKKLDENNNEIIPETFYLQLLNKDHKYIGQWNQNLYRFKPFSTIRTAGILVKKLTEIETRRR